MSAGNASANVCRIERADARSASARDDPINAVIHGYRTSSLNDWLTERLADPGLHGGLPRQAGQDRLTCEPREGGELERALRRGQSVRGGEDRRAPARREDAQAGGRFQRVIGGRVGRVVEAQFLQQRDVDGVRVRMKELSADVDGDAPPPILDHVRIAMTADLGSRLEQVDVVGVARK